MCFESRGLEMDGQGGAGVGVGAKLRISQTCLIKIAILKVLPQTTSAPCVNVSEALILSCAHTH